MGRLARISFLGLAIVLAATPALADPANVVLDGGCTIGWIGCPVEAGIPQSDGSYTCPLNAISIVGLTGSDSISVDPQDAHGVSFFKCSAEVEYGQPNPTGTSGSGGDVIAVDPEVICLLFPNACQGEGAVVIHPRTIGAVGTCSVAGGISRNFQSQFTPSGQANLTCFLPDPPQGE